jgi:non-heme chloroperoxidase
MTYIMLKKILIGILIFSLVITLLTQWQAQKINSATQEISYETLSQQPKGTEMYLPCPDGTKLRTVSAGEGKTIVLAHGVGGTIRDWNMVFNQLVADGYRVIAFEQRGHYKSTIGTEGVNSKAMASDYKTILDYFDVKEGVLVGHSMGGFLAIRFLLDYPDVAKQRLRSAIIMSSFAGDISRDNVGNKLQIPLITSGWMTTFFKSEALATVFQASIIGKPNKAIVQSAIDNFKVQNYDKLVPILKAFTDENYYPRLKEISIPCTIVVGTADKTSPAFHSETLAKDIPHATLVKIPERGHLLSWEDPKAVVAEIEKW